MKVGPEISDFNANAFVNPALTIEPPTNNLLEKETSDKTDNLLFMETSPLTNNLLFKEASDPTKISVLKETSLLNVVKFLTNKLELKETSPLTNNRLFMDTSPVEITVPVNEGAARGALAANELVNPVLTMDPPTNKLELKEESKATDSLLFMLTSDLTVNLLFKDKSPPTNKFEFKEASPNTVVLEPTLERITLLVIKFVFTES